MNHARHILVPLVVVVAIAGASFGLLVTPPAARAETYQIDPSHSHIGFSIRHMVISKVKGQFGKVDASLEHVEGTVTKARAVIETASIDTANENRDEHLRNEDFFDAAQYPQITFEATRIAKQDGQWIAHGKFTMHGVTKEIALPFKVNGPVKDPWGNTRLGIEARTTINRQDYGLSWSKTLETGGLVVGNEVELEIEAEFIRQ